MAVTKRRRSPLTSVVLLAAGSLVAVVSACSASVPTAVLPGTPLPETSGVISPANVGRLTELARWPVQGWVKWTIAFSPDGRLLAWSIDSRFDTGVTLWDVANGSVARVLTGHSERVTDLAFSPDGLTLAAGAWDKTVKIWDVTTGEALQTFAYAETPYGLAFSPDGRTLAVGIRDSTIQLWDVTNGRAFALLTGHSALVQSVAFSPDGTKLASGSFDGTVKLWDLRTGLELHTFRGHTESIWSVAFAPDGNTLASASSDSTVRLWDVDGGQELRVQSGKNAEGAWFDVAFSADGKLLMAASLRRLVVWDMASGHELRSHESQGLDSVDTLSLSPDGRLVATGGDGAVHLWGVP